MFFGVPLSMLADRGIAKCGQCVSIVPALQFEDNKHEFEESCPLYRSFEALVITSHKEDPIYAFATFYESLNLLTAGVVEWLENLWQSAQSRECGKLFGDLKFGRLFKDCAFSEAQLTLSEELHLLATLTEYSHSTEL